ncbi:hypothetical protein Ancab_034598, partial [Ancistrocladus abbreviatus]
DHDLGRNCSFGFKFGSVCFFAYDSKYYIGKGSSVICVLSAASVDVEFFVRW